MGLVLEGLGALTVVIALLWLWSLRGSVRQDAVVAQQRAQEDALAQEQAAREMRMRRPGERLHCLGCDTQFFGPLPDTGCPHCHLVALVVTEDDYQQGRDAARRAREET